MSRKHLEIIWKIELWFGTHSSIPRTICLQWWTDSWVSLNFSFELNGSKQGLKITNITQTGCSWLMLYTGIRPLKDMHARHNEGNRSSLCSCFSTKRKMDKFFQKSCSYSGDYCTRMRIRSKKIHRTQAGQVLQTFLQAIFDLYQIYLLCF